MNEKNGQNSLGLDICFEDSANPIDLKNGLWPQKKVK